MLSLRKQMITPYVYVIIILVPILFFVFYGIDTGLLPKFWEIMNPKEPRSADNPYYFVYMRRTFSFVETLEFDTILMVPKLVPLLSGIVVVPFIQMRDTYMQFAKPRWKNAKWQERHLMAWAILTAGGAIYAGYLLFVLWCRWMFDQTRSENIQNEFINNTPLALDGRVHPYLYVLLLGAIRFFLFPMVCAFLTIAISYITRHPYIYLLVPTVYGLLGTVLFCQGNDTDRWPLPLFSPENFIWMKSESYWDFGHQVSGFGGVLGAVFFPTVLSLIILYIGIRRQRS